MNHHAYLILGSLDDARAHVDTFGIERRGNPDVWEYSCETLSVDNARELKRRQESKAILGGKKMLLVSCTFITTEAQNSLLKVFEEPTKDTYIFLVLPSVTSVLPTLLSRLEVIQLETETVEGAAEAFLGATVVERQEIIKAIVENKDKAEAIRFLSGIEKVLSKNIAENKESLKIIIQMKLYLYSRSPSVKSIMEFVASFV